MLVRSGRAVAFPIYKSTFERQDDFVYRLQDPSNAHRDHAIQWRQDLGRSLDYLQTRADVDSDRLGFFGSSFGGRIAAIMLAVEPRFRAAVSRAPGLSPLPTQPVVDTLNFVTRVQLPVRAGLEVLKDLRRWTSHTQSSTRSKRRSKRSAGTWATIIGTSTTWRWLPSGQYRSAEGINPGSGHVRHQ